VTEAVQEEHGEPTGTGPSPTVDDDGPSAWRPQTAATSQAAERVLLDAFLRMRSRTRGPLVAVNERTMITNVGASELLQPGDRRLLWEHATRGPSPTGHGTTVALSSGVAVKVLAHLIGGPLSPTGAVLRLAVEIPSRDLAPVAAAVSEGPQPSAAGRTLDPSLMTGWTELTDTERTVAELVARGMTNKQAGRRLFLSRHTVDYHLRRVFKKLGLNSRVELARALGEHYEALNG
jgi:DNA-binding CsgD family transcriptional regulator